LRRAKHLCCSVLQCVQACCNESLAYRKYRLQWVAVGCSGLQWPGVAVGCSGLQWVAVGCSGLQWIEIVAVRILRQEKLDVVVLGGHCVRFVAVRVAANLTGSWRRAAITEYFF